MYNKIYNLFTYIYTQESLLYKNSFP